MALVDLKSDLTWYGRPPAVNFQPDDIAGNVGAPVQGFVTNQTNTGYLGISGNTYTYSENQSRIWKTLRDDPNNVYQSYIDQPLILRGMQRPGELNSKPQRIGWRFDDGLIRGGAVGAVEAAAIDTVRIAKWLASPKGLLWIVKQVGLGLTNPKVETIGTGILSRQTRIHTGITILPSVAGTAFGLHFTRHGIPFANEVASYENVQRAKILAPTLYKNRLDKLRKILFSSVTLPENPITKRSEIKRSTIVFRGTPILELSGLLGPNSVYGIGATTIRRAVDTQSDATLRAGIPILYQYGSSYMKSLRANTKNDNDVSGKTDTKDSFTISDTLTHPLVKKLDTNTTDLTPPYTTNKYTPGHGTVDPNKYGDGGLAWPIRVDSIDDYITLPYSAIPTRTKGTMKINDFRKNIEDAKETLSGNETSILGTGTQRTDYYQTYNLERNYGFGELGKPGTDRSDTGRFVKTGKEFNGTNRIILSSDSNFRGDRITALDIDTKNTVVDSKIYPDDAQDLIKFYFEDGKQGKRVMPFRCTITGLSDSFSPGWDRIDIMGRPEGAYLYSTFERSIQFNFNVFALSRSEMIPMWRKLNYLASYTMPEYDSNTSGRAGGPFMRLTIGDMYRNCPGFIESLTYSVPDEMSWDIADDIDEVDDAKQLPMGMEVSVTYKIVGNTRPQLQGEVYELNKGKSQWLSDSLTYKK
jgi:hypothetical protein